jgi:hypothetical protein
MQIITLTTDFGLQDYYIPALKGAILSRRQDLNIVDISHTIRNHDIVQAAFTLKNAWAAFPEGTIHLVSVHNFGGERSRFLAFEYQKHFFIGPDNGIFSLIFPNLFASANGHLTPALFTEIPFGGLNFNPLRDAIADAIGKLAHQLPLSELGAKAEDIVQRFTLQPVILPSQIRGSVIHIDNYQNVITNITKDLFEQVGRGRSFHLYFKRNEPISQLSKHYNDVPIGETLCLFNSDYLEISIHMGKASELLGLKVEDTIQIDFH